MGMAEAVKAQHVLPFLPAYCSFADRMESVMPSEMQPPGGRLELAHASVSECWQVADTVSVMVMLHTQAPGSASSCEKLGGPLSRGPLIAPTKLQSGANTDPVMGHIAACYKQA